MEYFRKYIIYIRKMDNTKTKPSFTKLMIIILSLSLIAGQIADIFLPVNFICNLLRGLIAVIAGVSSASYFLVRLSRTRRDKYIQDNNYLPLRKRLSYRQRSNISIIISLPLAIFILLSSKASLILTLKTSFAISSGIMLVAFARKDRSEFLKEVYDIPDVRDLEFNSKRVDDVSELHHDDEADKKSSKK